MGIRLKKIGRSENWLNMTGSRFMHITQTEKRAAANQNAAENFG
jgi:hypothetical protein